MIVRLILEPREYAELLGPSDPSPRTPSSYPFQKMSIKLARIKLFNWNLQDAS